MGYRLSAAGITLDGRDVAAWVGRPWTGTVDADWVLAGERYVAEHPRTGRTSDAQRLALLRRLAAGPAHRIELLAALRSAGYVGATDLENRLRELKAGDTRAAGRTGLTLTTEGDQVALAESFPALDDPDRRALGFAKVMVGRLDGPMAQRASIALDRLLPDVATAAATSAASYPASPADLERFHAALETRRPVRIRYFSLNRGATGTYTVVPVQYVTVGTTIKAICVDTDSAGTAGVERQFALDRLSAVEELPTWRAPRAAALQLQRERIVLHVTDPLYRVMRDRDLFGIATDISATQDASDDSWRVTGEFPVALAWDVLEQLCAWAGSAQVWEPLWLVNAVVRRLTAGLRLMQEGADFELVKPEPQRTFASHGEAVSAEAALPPRPGPRKLRPR